jgi:cyclopropane-fatty-acyl-phospholipid synthase
MNILALALGTVERTPLPDGITLAGMDFLASRARRRLSEVTPESEAAFTTAMRYYPVARPSQPDAVNRDMPAEFFEYVLGPQRKYSCCLYPGDTTTLEEAENYALAETVAHADISDGQTILELGCGWGALSLYLARNFPYARITAVTASAAQRDYIESQIATHGLSNLAVLTADMNTFLPHGSFDRIVSVDMCEHMSNWQILFERAREWLNEDGRLFLHVFTHRNRSYRLDRTDTADWIAHYFFTGGIMPAFDLPHRFADLLEVEQEWRWSGNEYRRTALDWLDNFDRNVDKIDPIMKEVYGAEATLWRRRWRLFFLATAGLFGHANGCEWGVGHYRLRPVSGRV